MAWQRLQKYATPADARAWVQWIDPVAFAAQLVALQTAMAADATIATLPYAQQVTATMVLYECLRCLPLTLDIDPLNAWPYSPRRIMADPGNNDWPGLFSPSFDPVTGATIAPTLPSPATWRIAAQTALHAADGGELAGHIADGDDVLIDLWPRVDLTNGSTLARGLVRRDQIPDPDSGSDIARATGPNGWSDWSWKEWHPGFASASSRHEYSIVVPLNLSWQLGMTCARLLLQAVTPTNIITGTLQWIVTRNLALAKAIGGPDAGYSVLVQADPENSRVLAAASTQADLNKGLGYLGSAVTATAAIPAVGQVALAAGAIVGALGSAIKLLFAAIGTAVGAAFDVWGRQEAYTMVLANTGNPVLADGQPTLAAPLPSGFVAKRTSADAAAFFAQAAPSLTYGGIVGTSTAPVVFAPVVSDTAVPEAPTSNVGWWIAGGVGLAAVALFVGTTQMSGRKGNPSRRRR